MTAALTPEVAIAYVRELSADVRAVVVLAADGSCLAGPGALAAPARAYLQASGDEADAATRVPAGLVLAARTPDHAVVVAAGPLALAGPTALDARTAVEALGRSATGEAPAPADAAGPREARPLAAGTAGIASALTAAEAAEALISAADRAN